MSLQLPAMLQLVADAAGLNAAINLAAVKGGRMVYVPQAGRELDPGHWLMVTVGPQGAAAMMAQYGGMQVNIPLGPFSGNRAKVWAAIRTAKEQGLSAFEAAQTVGVAHKTVRRHWNNKSGKQKPLPLFDK